MMSQSGPTGVNSTVVNSVLSASTRAAPASRRHDQVRVGLHVHDDGTAAEEMACGRGSPVSVYAPMLSLAVELPRAKMISAWLGAAISTTAAHGGKVVNKKPIR